MHPHEVLGLRPGASRAEVAAAFRRFALRNHPDRGGDPARFQAGVEAYRRLMRPERPGNVVFHRRTRRRVASLVRLAGRRVSAFRFRP